MKKFACLLSVVMMTALVGCGDSLPPLTPVTGTVTMDGEALDGANVTLMPAENTSGRAANGVSDASGNFTLSTTFNEELGTAPGMIGGIYSVMVSKTEVVVEDTGLNMEDMSTMDGANTMYESQFGDMTEDGENDGGYGDPESLIPIQFGLADSNNPLKTVTIGGTEEAAGPAQSVTITLDSKALTGTVQ